MVAYAGFIISEFGLWMAMLVYAYEQGGAATAGLVGAAQQLPSAVVALSVAALVERSSPVVVLLGGYAAGRMASRSGLKHGILVPVLALVATIFLAGIGTLLGLSFIDQLSGVTLPGIPGGATQNLGTILTVSGILALLAPFIGGAIGGLWGARTGSHRP